MANKNSEFENILFKTGANKQHSTNMMHKGRHWTQIENGSGCMWMQTEKRQIIPSCIIQRIFDAAFALTVCIIMLPWPPERDAASAAVKLLLGELYFRQNRHFVIKKAGGLHTSRWHWVKPNNLQDTELSTLSSYRCIHLVVKWFLVTV